jgi:hypothetical protein
VGKAGLVKGLGGMTGLINGLGGNAGLINGLGGNAGLINGLRGNAELNGTCGRAVWVMVRLGGVTEEDSCKTGGSSSESESEGTQIICCVLYCNIDRREAVSRGGPRRRKAVSTSVLRKT